VLFTDMVIRLASGAPVDAVWQANPKPAQKRFCQESISIGGPAAVTIGFTK
jgi:hypothetical protein